MKTNNTTGSKSVDAYLVQAAVEMAPAVSSVEELRDWMNENMLTIVERASAMQSDLVNRFFASDAMQSQAKRIIGRSVWEVCQA
jgi:hypothetical protein